MCKITQTSEEIKLCDRCGSQPRIIGRFCSHECRIGVPIEHHDCERCGKNFIRAVVALERIGDRVNFCSTLCYKNSNRFPHFGTWRGGPVTRPSSHVKMRQRIIERDNETCQHCGKLQEHPVSILTVHHIIPFRVTRDDTDSNLITLCHKCHDIETEKENKLFKSGYYKACI